VGKLVQLLNSVLRDQRGATAIEYGLIAALICVAIVSIVGNVGQTIADIWAFVADEVLDA
jgi:pilus assembly protein Flp/PilA